MKFSDGFDARRLRPPERKSWRMRFGAAVGALLAASGTLLAMAGTASLFGDAETLGSLAAGRNAAFVLLALGLLLLWAGVVIWRRCRRRLYQAGALSLSPGLMKKRD